MTDTPQTERLTPRALLLEARRQQNRNPADRELCVAYGFDRIMYSFDDAAQMGATHLRIERGEIVVETTVPKAIVVAARDTLEIWLDVFDSAAAELERQEAARHRGPSKGRRDELRAAVVATSIAMRVAELVAPPADDSVAEARLQRQTARALLRWRAAVDALVAEGP